MKKRILYTVLLAAGLALDICKTKEYNINTV